MKNIFSVNIKWLLFGILLWGINSLSYKIQPESINIDFWPDMREYEKKYAAPVCRLLFCGSIDAL